MTRRAIVLFATALLLLGNAAAQAPAAQLPKIIEQNIKSAMDASKRLSGDPKTVTLQLWIHVRNRAQQREVQRRLDWFKRLQVGGQTVDVRPIQIVDSGPRQSQLRFFKPADQALAPALLTELRKAVPGIVLQDLSGQFRQVSWIEPGHFELWLAPSVVRILTP